jgi:hypothetical protein
MKKYVFILVVTATVVIGNALQTFAAYIPPNNGGPGTGTTISGGTR